MRTLEEVEQFALPIWRAERGRYGLAKVKAPQFSRRLWGVSRGYASGESGGIIKLPRWARNPWVILHEMAHLLTPKDEAHGPRFVGVLIGLVSRHMGQDAYALMAAADEMGVKYHVRSIGTVPVIPLWRKVLELLPARDMELAVELGVSYRQIHGAALYLIREGKARWYRGRLIQARAVIARATGGSDA